MPLLNRSISIENSLSRKKRHSFSLDVVFSAFFLLRPVGLAQKVLTLIKIIKIPLFAFSFFVHKIRIQFKFSSIPK